MATKVCRPFGQEPACVTNQSGRHDLHATIYIVGNHKVTMILVGMFHDCVHIYTVCIRDVLQIFVSTALRFFVNVLYKVSNFILVKLLEYLHFFVLFKC